MARMRHDAGKAWDGARYDGAIAGLVLSIVLVGCHASCVAERRSELGGRMQECQEDSG